MKLNALIVPAAALLVAEVSAGPVVGAGCLAACTAAAITCHGVGHALGPFTFGLSSIGAVGGCHGLWAACSSKCAVAALLPTA